MNHTMSRMGKYVFSLLLIMMLGLFLPSNVRAQQVKTYKEAITKGNQLLKQKKYINAKAYYQMALRYREQDPYATQKIIDIVKVLKAGESREEAYYNVIDKADGYYDKDMLAEALKSYQKALTIISGDSYALGRIKEIHRQQTVERGRLIAYNRFMQAGDSLLSQNLFNRAITAFEKAQNLFPNKSMASDKLVLARQMQHNYLNRKKRAQKAIETAGRYLLIKNYADALRYYKLADSLMPGNPVVIKRIYQLKPKARTQIAYNRIANAADRLYIAKNYMAARGRYQEAQKLWPENSYPAEMISKVDGQLTEQRKHLEQNYRTAVAQADSLFKIREMENARAEYNLALNLKPNESYPQQQLTAIKAWFIRQQQQLQTNYHSVIRSADSLFDKGAYPAAQEKYEQALKTRSNDPYPKQKLSEIDKRLAAIAKQAELDAQYQSLIAEARKLQAAGHFELAINKFRQALGLKGTDAFSASQIAKINRILAQMQKQKEQDANFAKQIVLGQRLLQQKQLEEAKKAFANALAIKPEETLPARRIHLIDSLIQQKIHRVQIEKEYQAAVQQGKQLYGQKQYENALVSFKKAKSLKPEDTYSGKMIQSIETTLAVIARAKALQQAYVESNTQASQLLKEQKYELAKAQYQNSLTLKPDESFPKKQIADINTILVRLAKERDQRYASALSRADNLYNSRNYQKAVALYEEAASIKPGEPYPGEQITACKTFIVQIVAEQTQNYKLAIVEADKLYTAKVFDKAIKAYKKAEKAKPDETYPAEMIKKIVDYIQKNAIVDLIKEKTLIPAGETRKLSFKALPINVRKSNYVYVKARNVDGKSFRIIFTYGRDKSKNGGFVVQVPSGKANRDFIIRVGIQYKWFSDDNNWLSIYPENNPIEISLVRISKSD
jgi:tetratricopeptide (TPR) repeat protein